jgi:hypothetical protein
MASTTRAWMPPCAGPALYLHGGMDTTGAVCVVQANTTGLRWRKVRPPVCVTGTPGKQDLQARWGTGRAACGRGRRVIGASCHGSGR